MDSAKVDMDSLRPRFVLTQRLFHHMPVPRASPKASPDSRGGNQTLFWVRGEEQWSFLQSIHHSGDEELDSNSDSQTTCWVILGELLSF